MERVFNFSAGPSMLPLEVLDQAQKEFVCYGSSGMSVMEMSHRSKVFEGILEKAQADLRDLMHIPDNYKILFLQGGGSTQFAMIPLNLMNKNNKADYVGCVILSQKVSKCANFNPARENSEELIHESDAQCFSTHTSCVRSHPRRNRQGNGSGEESAPHGYSAYQSAYLSRPAG